MSGRSKVQDVSCQTCGAKTVEYRHRLSKGIVSALIKLYEKARASPFLISELGLSHSQMANFQKLAYWRLADRAVLPGDRKGGVWAVSIHGEAFIRGLSRMREIAVTYRGNIQRHEGTEIYIFSVIEGYQYRGDFKDQIKKAGDDPTPMMI